MDSNGNLRHFALVLSDLDVQLLLHRLIEHNSWDSKKTGRITAEGARVYDADNLMLRVRAEPPYRRSMPSAAILSAAQPAITRVLRAVPCEHLGQIVVTRLRPGDKIDWHTDPPPPDSQPYFQRYQIPLSVAPGVRFCIEDEQVYMQPGTVWQVDINRRHAVFNDSDEDRISMFVDIRPFSL